MGVLLFLFGIFVGVLSGMLGIGGGVVLVPGLILLFGFSQPAAQGTSLAVLSLPIAAGAALVYYQNGHVRLPVAACIAAGFVVGALVGARLVPHVPVAALRIGFAGLLFYIGIVLAMDLRPTRTKAALPALVAAAVAVVAARLLGRTMKPAAAMEPPDGHTEYHI